MYLIEFLKEPGGTYLFHQTWILLLHRIIIHQSMLHLIVILLCMKVQIYSITMKHGIEDVLLMKSYNQYLQNWVGIVQKNSVNDLTQDLNFFKRK